MHWSSSLEKLMSHYLMRLDLHHKHCRQAWGSVTTAWPSVLHPRRAAESLSIGSCAERQALKRCCVTARFTCSFGVAVRNWFGSWTGRVSEEHVHPVPAIKAIPADNLSCSKRPLFYRLFWAAWYAHKISQAHRTTTEFTNNHGLTICLTRFWTRKFGVTAGLIEKGLVPRQKEFKMPPN